ncbi:MAG TPA: M13-type metalloendopeptidase [Vicinamibacterales bacterium]|nr:M13-type metalloendopeptidase [Vicinamibacterales bacterium]
MKRAVLLAMCLGAAACMKPAEPNAATKAVESGLDPESFDKEVRPQDDLFRHVNGSWLARTEIPADKASYGAFDILFDKAQADLRAIVEEAAKSTTRTPGSEAQKIGDFYESFMNEPRAEQLGITPLKPELDAIDAIKTKTDLARHFARFFKLNLINPIVGYVDGDAQQPTNDILYVFQGGLGLPDRDYYIKNDDKLKEYREKYVGFVGNILGQAGDANAGKSAREIFVLETRLARAHWTNVESRDAVKTYNKVTVADLAKQFPGFDWDAWTKELGVNGVPAVVVNQPSYLKALAATVNELPVDAWKPYLKASLLNGFAPYLNKSIVDAEFGFYNTTLRGVKEQQPRWKRGVNTVNGNLGEMLGKLYVERHFKPEAKARMEGLVANLREAYRLGIDKLEWMGPETKKQAQEKLAKFTPKIGYPNKWRDYSKLEIKKDDLVGNMIRAFEHENNYQLGKAGKPIDPEQWGMTPQTINAYYNPVRNEIVFPAAILQPPFFNLDAEDAVNYGGIGAVIGHEMGHGFDDQGRRYDATGALRDWWTKADEAEYMKRAKVLVDQFNEFEPLPGLHVNGELTLGENLADLTGLVISHQAYQLSLKGKDAPTIDGITADQRFYMGWSQSWKAKERDESLRQQVLTNVHSPEMYRANGPIRNIPEFYMAFGVKEGDKHYLPPDRRVKIW